MKVPRVEVKAEDPLLYGLHVRKDEDSVVVPAADIPISRFLTTFCHETSMQGLTSLVIHKGYIKKVFWTCCILLCLAGLYAEVNIFFGSFLKWEPSTRITVNQPRSIHFPAVTLCNSNPILNSWFKKHSTKETLETWGSDIANLVSNNSATPTPARKKRQSIAGVIGGIITSSADAVSTDTCKALDTLYRGMSLAYSFSETERKEAGHQLCDIVISANWNGKMLTVDKAFNNHFWNPLYGNCWIFNLGASLADVNLENQNLWKSKTGLKGEDVLRATTLGKNYGLYVLLNLDLDEYLDSSSSSGWRLLVHNQTSMPFPEGQGVYIKPGTSTQIQIKQSHVEKLAHVDNKLYTARYSDCRDARLWKPDDPDNVYTNEMPVAYNKESCRRTCYQREVMKTCGCFDFKFPGRGKAFSDIVNADSMPVCKYIDSTTGKWSEGWKCKDKVWDAYIAENITCDCTDACITYNYDVYVSQKEWPTPTKESSIGVCDFILSHIDPVLNDTSGVCQGPSRMRERFNKWSKLKERNELAAKCGEGVVPSLAEDWVDFSRKVIGRRYAEAYIYYQTFDNQEIVEFENYAFADLVAYFGGIIGLFFGVSMLTFCEYILLAVDLIVIAFAKIGRSMSSSSQKNLSTVRRTSISRRTSIARRPSVSPSQPSNVLYGGNRSILQAQAQPPLYALKDHDVRY